MLIALFLSPGILTAQDITVKNKSRYLGDKTWEWTIYLDGSSAKLDQVRSVRYTLHPTFPKPVVTLAAAQGRQSKFAFTARGWGTFVIPVLILFKDGSRREFRHQLRFEAPRNPLAGVRLENRSRQLTEDMWEWTVFLTGDAAGLAQVRCVEYTLHPTFPNPVRRICDDRTASPGRFALKASGWGTFEIKAKVILRDDRVVEMRHQLAFVR